MRRTYIDRTSDYYRHIEEELDLMMGSFSPVIKYRFAENTVGGERRMLSRCILVVDDEERIRNMYQRYFARKGFEVFTAASAVEAKDILVRRRIGVVFLDINMADIDGVTLYDLVRSFHPGVRVIVSSVYPIDEQRRMIMDADAYFDKSDGKEALWGLVSHMV